MPKFGEWTNAADELPTDGDYSVLVAFNNGSVEDMRMWHVQDWSRGLIDKSVRVTHWMPMPTPPQGE